MNAKEYLNSYRRALMKVKRYGERIEQVQTLLRSVDLDGLPHGTAIRKPTEEYALNLAILKQEYVMAQLEAETIRQEVATTVEKLEDEKSKELLYSRYILLLPWSKVARRLDVLRPGKEYELKSVIGYMHRKALRELEELWNIS